MKISRSDIKWILFGVFLMIALSFSKAYGQPNTIPSNSWCDAYLPVIFGILIYFAIWLFFGMCIVVDETYQNKLRSKQIKTSIHEKNH